MWVCEWRVLAREKLFSDEVMEYALGTVPDTHEESFHAAFLLRPAWDSSVGGGCLI